MVTETVHSKDFSDESQSDSRLRKRVLLGFGILDAATAGMMIGSAVTGEAYETMAVANKIFEKFIPFLSIPLGSREEVTHSLLIEAGIALAFSFVFFFTGVRVNPLSRRFWKETGNGVKKLANRTRRGSKES